MNDYNGAENKKSSCRISLTDFLISLLLLTNCAGIPIGKIPTPSPGLVLFINPNEWAQGEVIIFDSNINKDNLFDISPSGIFRFKSRPILRIPVPPAPATNIPAISTAVLSPEQAYSLVFFWENRVGQFINFSYGSVRTSDKAFNQSYTDFIGRRFWADQVIYLPRVAHTEAQPYRLQIRAPE